MFYLASTIMFTITIALLFYGASGIALSSGGWLLLGLYDGVFISVGIAFDIIGWWIGDLMKSGRFLNENNSHYEPS